MEQKTKQMVIGGVAGAVTDTVIDFPLASLFGGKNPVFQIKREGNYWYGIGLGDVVSTAIGGGLFFYGRKRNETVKNVGKGWLIYMGVIKGAELVMSIYAHLREQYPITDTGIIIGAKAPQSAKIIGEAPPEPEPKPALEIAQSLFI